LSSLTEGGHRALSSSFGPPQGSAARSPAPTRVAASGREADAPLPIEDPDRDLVVRAVAGDRRAFETLLRRHYERIHRVAWRMTGSGTEAQDITQDVCCVLVEKIATFRGEAKFGSWLMGIVMNACRDHHRKRKTWTRVKDGLSVLARLAPVTDGRDHYRRTWLESEVARLDPLLREAVVLVYGADLTHAEAALALGIAESTVSWRIHQANRQLRLLRGITESRSDGHAAD
jgi:RNA polymerase sigma-70 factor (ECF subfamily)